MIADAIALYDLVRRSISDIKEWNNDMKTFSALFNWQGNKLEGDDEIRVRLLPSGRKGSRVWFYMIEPIEGYRFIRIPTNASGVVERLGAPLGTDIPDANIFRYTGHVEGRLLFGEIPSVMVDFMVFAYPPGMLLKMGRNRL